MSPEGLLELAPLRPVAQDAAHPDAYRLPLQQLTRRLAFDPASFDDADRAYVLETFDERAADWSSRKSPDYLLPLEDALERGGVPRGGRCVEIGSGTGIQTPTLTAHFATVVSLDLSLEMLVRTPANGAHLVRADAGALPLADGCATAVVCVNAFLFAPEYARVLAPGGVVVFCSTRGAATPIYLSPEETLAALNRLGGGRWAARSAAAGPGRWTVAARLEAR